MNQLEIVNKIMELTRFPRGKTETFLTAYNSVVETALLEGKKVRIHKIGTLSTYMPKRTNYYNPISRELVKVAPRRRLRITAVGVFGRDAGSERKKINNSRKYVHSPVTIPLTEDGSTL